MSSCQGELPEKKFKVEATGSDGRVFLDETISTLKNGFFEIWLPRDRRYNLTIRRGDRSAEGFIGAYDYSPTCITTFQLT